MINIIYFHQSNAILQILKKIYMFPALKAKTIRNILEILVDDWKYTGTLNSNFAVLSWSRHLPPIRLGVYHE